MPELDPDLVTLLTLGLLGLIVICLLGVMGSIGRVRKAIERAAAQRGEEREDRWQAPGAAAAAPAAVAQAATADPEPAIERQAIPAHREPEPAAVAAEAPVTAAAGGASQGPGVIAAESNRAASEPAETHSSMASETAAAEPEPAAASSGTAVGTQAVQEPQEQPFERDGRWWFRRGSELLVYDEGTGQWIAAPETARPAAAATQPIPTTISNVSGTREPTEQSAGSEQHGFWKCPSCGAVNGSTATSCRMCFTARP
jgi:uncharacterized iron-regulated membrane protein